MSKIVCAIWVCMNCVYVHANGECGEIHAETCAETVSLMRGDFVTAGCDCGAKEPLSAIPAGHSVTAGLSQSDHEPGCVNRTLVSNEWIECDCSTRTFSTSACEGCGSSLHGEREMMTLWDDRPEEKWEVVEFSSAPMFTPRRGMVSITVWNSKEEAESDAAKRTKAEPDFETAYPRTFTVRQHTGS